MKMDLPGTEGVGGKKEGTLQVEGPMRAKVEGTGIDGTLTKLPVSSWSRMASE